jgi:hypothetical protein
VLPVEAAGYKRELAHQTLCLQPARMAKVLLEDNNGRLRQTMVSRLLVVRR